MRFELNAVFVSPEPNVDAALVLLGSQGLEAIVTDARQDPLRVPHDVSVNAWDWSLQMPFPAPWADDERIVAASDTVSDLLESGGTLAGAISALDREIRDGYLASVEEAAERWIVNIAALASGQVEVFERRYANRLAVSPVGSIIFCPEDYETPEPTDANLYGEVLMAARDVFPALAAAMGIHPLADCRLQVTVPGN